MALDNNNYYFFFLPQSHSALIIGHSGYMVHQTRYTLPHAYQGYTVIVRVIAEAEVIAHTCRSHHTPVR